MAFTTICTSVNIFILPLVFVKFYTQDFKLEGTHFEILKYMFLSFPLTLCFHHEYMEEVVFLYFKWRLNYVFLFLNTSDL